MNNNGFHAIADLWFAPPVAKDDQDLLDFASEALERSGMTVLERLLHHFEPQGMTVIFLLAESHFSMHTFPEHGYISLDCYTCGDEGNPVEVVQHFIKRVKPDAQKVRAMERGGPMPGPLVFKGDTSSLVYIKPGPERVKPQRR